MSAVTVYVHVAGREPVRLSAPTAAVLMAPSLAPRDLGRVVEELEREELVPAADLRGPRDGLVSELTDLGWRVLELLRGELS